MGLTADAPAARAEATRERIAEVAERLFRTLGYQKTAVADIARELGMSPANVYRFYPSKSAINETIAERLLGAMLAEVRGIAEGGESAAERLRAVLSALFESKLSLFFGERRLHDMVTAAMAEHWGVIERFLRQVEATIGEVLADGVASGEFDPSIDPQATAKTVMHAVVAWNYPALLEVCIAQRGQSVEEMRAQMAAMTAFILRALRP